MEILPKLIASHAGFAYLSIILLLIRGVLAFRNVDWRQYKVLKIAPHAIDSLLLLSGLMLFAMTAQFFGISEMDWLLPKIGFIVLYILFSVKAFKKGKPFSKPMFALALASFIIAMVLAMQHQF